MSHTERGFSRDGAHAMSGRVICTSLLIVAAAWQLGGCATAPTSPATNQSAAAPERAVEARYGIRVEALRLSAAGYILDLRYRVLDSQKAAPLLDRKLHPYLLDESRGAKLGVPDSEILGQLRQTSRNNKVYADRTYFILFANPGQYLNAGDKVTLVVGDAKFANLVIE